MSNSLAPTSRKKPWGCQNINHLPDDILHHLLSFLSTKEAVATSILSKRWRCLWTLVPVLDFRDSPSWRTDEKRRIAFNQFVYRVLIFNRVVSLHRFRLNCDIIHGPSCLSTWIDGAICRRDVREVDISISAKQKSQFLKLPSNFFIIKDLKVLKLSLGILVDVPNSMSVCFPSLKILHLESVEYANNESVSRLLCGCTVLEEFLVIRSFEDNVRKFIVNVPTLKTLNITHYLRKSWLEFVSHRYEYELKINAPILEDLNIIDRVGSLVHLESVFIRLNKANIYFNGSNDLSELSKALCNAKFLCISCRDSMASVKDDSFPLFHNLIQLRLQIKFVGWDVIPHFLEKSPYLEVLVIELSVITTNKLERVPKCLSPCLRKVYGVGFQGHVRELEMVEYLLKNASSLELIQICSFNLMSPESKLFLLQKLSEFPRRSRACKLKFM